MELLAVGFEVACSLICLRVHFFYLIITHKTPGPDAVQGLACGITPSPGQGLCQRDSWLV